MGVAASLNGTHVLEARLSIPAWGASYHDVALEGPVPLTGAAVLVVADLTIRCTVIAGGPDQGQGRSFFRLVAGAGGWGKKLPAKSYSNDAGVKLSTVIGDAAAECGETLDPTTVDQTLRLGPSWTRPRGPACRALELLSPNAWYVGEDGLTRLGSRPPGVLTAAATATSQVDLARGTVTLASDTIANVLPGLVANGLTAVDVEHSVDAKGGLRSKLWGKQGTGTSRRLAAFRAIVEQLDPNRMFRAVYEYRVVAQSANRLDLQPVQVSTGMPVLRRVVVRPGVAGTKATYTPGSRVLVGFVNADPARPAVLGFEDPDGGGFLPPTSTIDAPSLALGPTATTVSAGPAPVTLAKSAGLLTTLNAIQTWADALNTALAAPAATVGTVAAAMSTPTTILNGAISGAATSVPTTVLKGT